MLFKNIFKLFHMSLFASIDRFDLVFSFFDCPFLCKVSDECRAAAPSNQDEGGGCAVFLDYHTGSTTARLTSAVRGAGMSFRHINIIQPGLKHVIENKIKGNPIQNIKIISHYKQITRM